MLAGAAPFQTWEFEAQHVARILSPKKLKSSFPVHRQVHGRGDTTDPSLLGVPHEHMISGTYQFMSRGLLAATARNRCYVYPPAGDIESFFWVGFWSTLQNQNFSRDVLLTEKSYAKTINQTAPNREGTINDISETTG
ncbi:hypothetical protein C8R42DRAFT_692557 [Lentinula raphanica]|nr:hypothetical protein C8R42DRAFT_692557 [Lentinula raphanica]